MGTRLSHQEIEQYQQGGFLTAPAVISKQQLVKLQAEADRLMVLCASDVKRFGPRIEWEKDHLAQASQEGMEKTIRKLEPISDLSPIFAELAFSPDLTGPIEAIFGEPSALFEDKLNLKLPGGSAYPWHQDWVCCWQAHTDRLITCFIYLDDANAENGCLQVVPGSHLGKPRMPFRPGSRFEVEPGCVDREKIQPVPLKAGEMIFFDPYLLHFSDQNKGNAPRRAIIYTYYPRSLGVVNADRFPTGA